MHNYCTVFLVNYSSLTQGIFLGVQQLRTTYAHLYVYRYIWHQRRSLLGAYSCEQFTASNLRSFSLSRLCTLLRQHADSYTSQVSTTFRHQRHQHNYKGWWNTKLVAYTYPQVARTLDKWRQRAQRMRRMRSSVWIMRRSTRCSSSEGNKYLQQATYMTHIYTQRLVRVCLCDSLCTHMSRRLPGIFTIQLCRSHVYCIIKWRHN